MNMYFIALVLPSSLNEKILPFKHMMKERYDCRVGLRSPAHITIAPPFRMNGEAEEGLRQALERFGMGITPFTITTRNFSAFRPGTIFVDVVVDEALGTFKKNADKFFSGHREYPIKIETRPFHPHITIATRDLPKKDFAEAWHLFEKESFDETWLAESLSLLRHNSRDWDVVFTAPFTA